MMSAAKATGYVGRFDEAMARAAGGDDRWVFRAAEDMIGIIHYHEEFSGDWSPLAGRMAWLSEHGITEILVASRGWLPTTLPLDPASHDDAMSALRAMRVQGADPYLALHGPLYERIAAEERDAREARRAARVAKKAAKWAARRASA